MGGEKGRAGRKGGRKERRREGERKQGDRRGKGQRRKGGAGQAEGKKKISIWAMAAAGGGFLMRRGSREAGRPEGSGEERRKANRDSGYGRGGGGRGADNEKTFGCGGAEWAQEAVGRGEEREGGKRRVSPRHFLSGLSPQVQEQAGQEAVVQHTHQAFQLFRGEPAAAHEHEPEGSF